MTRPSLRLASFSLLAVGVLSAAHADYLFDPAGGSTVFSSANGSYDDSIAARSLGGTFSFFGTDVTDVTLSTNGNLNFSGSGAYANETFPNSLAMIAPLWDDLYVYQNDGSTISDKTMPGVYTATWDHVGSYSNPSAHYSFQVSLFSAATTVGGFTFQPGDVAFSYAGVDPTFRNGDATVGLSKGDGVGAVTPFGNDGILTDAMAGALPTADGFALFRANGDGNYASSIGSVQATPEPASMAALGVGVLGLLRRRRRA